MSLLALYFLLLAFIGVWFSVFLSYQYFALRSLSCQSKRDIQ
jgi:hypothetical protein